MKLESLAKNLGLPWEGDPSVEIAGLAGLVDAGPSDLSFVASAYHQAAFAASGAGAFILPQDFDRAGCACLRSAAPYVDFARAVDLFFPRVGVPEPGVHPTAVIGEDVALGQDVSVGPYVVIGSGSHVGDRTVVHPHVTIYANVRIGADCEIHSGAHLREGVRLGDHVCIQNGAVIGAEGFGFAFRPDGSRVRVPHRCGVEIGDDVEIGSNTTIDAAHPGHKRYGHAETRTRIGDASKIDNLVQVGHGVEVGPGSTLCASVALAGGVRIGRSVYLGGDAVCRGEVQIGDGCFVGGGAGVNRDLPPGSQVLGRPAIDRRLWARVVAARKRLPDLLRRMRRVEKRLGIDEND
jgi:UDP-3-O-[3-hydroxymyristoyl] glucosamine N-acyltransferase